MSISISKVSYIILNMPKMCNKKYYIRAYMPPAPTSIMYL